MNFITGDKGHSWQPIKTADTTSTSYWLNWRVLLCSIWLVISIAVSSYIIWRYEGSHNQQKQEIVYTQKESAGTLYVDEVWRPCLNFISPCWLLVFRIFAFLVMSVLLIVTGVVDGGSIFYFYTQWTFTLVTLYFGLGSVLSVYGCFQHSSRVGGSQIEDTEQGTYPSRIAAEQSIRFAVGKTFRPAPQVSHLQNLAGFWAYTFQIMFQIIAGAVLLTDCIFWFIIVPFLTIKDYDLNFLIINMHTINAVFLFGDTAINSLRFPWFRIAYFILYTSLFVVFQWILHACVAIWWPYPFLDLSSPFAPLWYASLGLMLIPCYGIFALIMKLKHYLLSKWFPDSYQSSMQ
ncbi:unnamed protein product [Rhodiola kirilowii]